MQVFWVSGPVGRIRSFNLSFKTVVIGCAALVLGLLAAGSLLQFMGFRMALEYDPAIARRLGNLRTALELESLNAVYHARLGELEAEQRKLAEQVTALQTAKARLAELLPPAVAREMPQRRAQGGLYLPQADGPASPTAASVLGRMNQVAKGQHAHQAWVGHELQGWQDTLAWLEGMPMGLPVAGRMAISSNFGERPDPINHRPALHTGIDFELPVGTPILAAGSGVVAEAGWDPQYGHAVLIRHRDGYTSRYAHASALLVKPGQAVARGQPIAHSGNRGRSTGPHLHFEVLRAGKYVDPAQYLSALADRR